MNASTSGFKAKDLDFSSLLSSSFYRSENGRDLFLGETISKHMGRLDRPSSTDTESAVTLAQSFDNKTFEIGGELAKYGLAQQIRRRFKREFRYVK